jgi:hypothetical protein
MKEIVVRPRSRGYDNIEIDLQVLELDIWAELICLQMRTVGLILRTRQWIVWFQKTWDILSLAEERNFSVWL